MTRRTRCNHHVPPHLLAILSLTRRSSPLACLDVITDTKTYSKFEISIFAHKRSREKHVQVFVFGVDLAASMSGWMTMRAFLVLQARHAQSRPNKDALMVPFRSSARTSRDACDGKQKLETCVHYSSFSTASPVTGFLFLFF